MGLLGELILKIFKDLGSKIIEDLLLGTKITILKTLIRLKQFVEIKAIFDTARENAIESGKALACALVLGYPFG